MKNLIPPSHRLTRLETKLLHALQLVLVDQAAYVQYKRHKGWRKRKAK